MPLCSQHIVKVAAETCLSCEQLELRWGAEMANELGLMPDGTVYATDEPGTDFGTTCYPQNQTP
jgi:hypothetical protein